jgi:type III pantothenate kinase
LACQGRFGIKSRFVDPSDTSEDALAIPLKMKIDNPARLGADRIASIVGAIARYGGSLIIFNFGTATVCEVIGDDNDYLGGIIAPGITISIKALHENAALLPAYEFQVPSKVIPTSTEDALYGGIFYATMGLVEKMVQEVQSTLPSHEFKVIATGWLAQVVSQHTNAIDVYDNDLVTFGLYTIYTNNR